ncbi:MAG TPA: hypothetical protein VIH95_09780 [Acidimicrobiales bacterium]
MFTVTGGAPDGPAAHIERVSLDGRTSDSFLRTAPVESASHRSRIR